MVGNDTIWKYIAYMIGTLWIICGFFSYQDAISNGDGIDKALNDAVILFPAYCGVLILYGSGIIITSMMWWSIWGKLFNGESLNIFEMMLLFSD